MATTCTEEMLPFGSYHRQSAQYPRGHARQPHLSHSLAPGSQDAPPYAGSESMRSDMQGDSTTSAKVQKVGKGLGRPALLAIHTYLLDFLYLLGQFTFHMLICYKVLSMQRFEARSLSNRKSDVRTR
jgi:hypothetical protein